MFSGLRVQEWPYFKLRVYGLGRLFSASELGCVKPKCKGPRAQIMGF